MNSSRLKDLQSDFCEFLQYGRHEGEIVDHLRPPGRMQGVLRLDVYRNAYFIRLEKALANDFPVTEKVLGQEEFARIAGEYVLAHPSRHPSLRYVGSEFSAWLRSHSRQAAGDLAAIEWAVMQVFDGPDFVPVVAASLDGMMPGDWARLSISLAPTLSVLTLKSNADLVWLAKADGVILKTETTRCISVSRDSQSRPVVADLDADSFAVLDALMTESRLAAVNECLARQQDTGKLPARVAKALHIAFANEWVAGACLNS